MRRISVIIAATRFNKNSLAALSGALQVNHATEGILPVVSSDEKTLLTAVREAAENGSLPVICFSFTTLNFLETAETLLRFKEALTDLPAPPVYVAGGPHPSGSPEETLRSGFNYVVRGDGEFAFPALMEAFMKGAEPLDIKGVCTLPGGEFTGTGFAAPVNLDDYPPFSKRPMKFTYQEITRGCPVACKYCQASYIQGGRYRHRSPSFVLKYTKKLVELGVNDLRFITPDCLSYGTEEQGRPDLKHLGDFLYEVRKIAGDRRVYYGTFPSEVWPSSVTEEAVALLRKYTSNEGIVVGAQTGSDRLLREIGRSHTVQDVRSAAEHILKAGFTANIDFMFGLPGETEEDEQATIEFMRELAAMDAKVHSHTFIPLSGTPYGNFEPPVLSRKTVKTLESLTGRGAQYGAWKKQMAESRKIWMFRKILRETGDIKRAVRNSDKISADSLF